MSISLLWFLFLQQFCYVKLWSIKFQLILLEGTVAFVDIGVVVVAVVVVDVIIVIVVVVNVVVVSLPVVTVHIIFRCGQ